MKIRNEQRCSAWQAWLAGEAEHPSVEQRSLHKSTMETPETLPELDDALRSLDE